MDDLIAAHPGGQTSAPGFGAYCATKFALEGLTQTLSQEVDFGVTFATGPDLPE